MRFSRWPTWPTWIRLLFTVTLGAIAAFGLAPWNLWPLTLLVLLVLPTLLANIPSARQAALIGWALGVGWFGHGLIWIVEPFLVDVSRYGWMAPFALLFMATGGGAFWALAFGVAYRVGKSNLTRILALLLTWSLIEFGRAYLFTGFPWAALAQIWPGTDPSLLLAWIGPHGLALATLMATLLPGWALSQSRGVRTILITTLPALGLIISSLSLGQTRPEMAPLTTKAIRLIQPNAPQDQKWHPDFAWGFFDRQIAFTKADSDGGPRPDLIVWPETAIPVLLDDAAATLETISIAAAGSPVFLGIQRKQGGRYYNSSILLDGQGQIAERYDKHHLVPFGEYIPFGDLAAKFGLFGLAAQGRSGFSAGPGPRTLNIDGIGKALPLICYEVVFPQDVGGTDDRPDYLLQITNDAWFGTNSGPYQHLAQARMRAIEQGLPMIRVANTGVSAMIDPWGRITASIPLGQAGFVDALLPMPRNPTYYARTGDTPVFVLLLIASIGLIWLQSRGNGRIQDI